MSHPFNLDICALESMDLDFQEELTDEEAAKVGGGISAADPKLGEQGGCILPPPKNKQNPRKPNKKQPKEEEIVYTTLAVGEEGGDATTLAVGEEGGGLGTELPLG